jgi:inward rectifier potassium channel
MSVRKKETKEDLKTADDTGFGQKYVGKDRLIKPDGSFNIIRKNITQSSIYEFMIRLPWPSFFLINFLGFLGINLVFAFFYTFNGVEHINIMPQNTFQNYLNSLYFSIQTFTSVGYGNLNPQDNVSNIIASINAFTGLFCFALATGLFFARFSKPRVNIIFSDNFLFTPFDGKKSIQLRLVNANNNVLLQMQSSLSMTWLEEDAQGILRRKFRRLKLEVDFIYLFPLNWTLVHKIDEESPFWGKTREELLEMDAELLVFVRGFDDTYGDFIYKNCSYVISQMKEGMAFLPMYYSENGNSYLDIEKINDMKPVTS